MDSSVEVDLDLEIDLDKPIICEVRWWDEKNKISKRCDKTAQWVGLCHDEVNTHDYQQTLFCGKCYLLAALKKVCLDDGIKLIIKARKL